MMPSPICANCVIRSAGSPWITACDHDRGSETPDCSATIVATARSETSVIVIPAARISSPITRLPKSEWWTCQWPRLSTAAPAAACSIACEALKTVCAASSCRIRCATTVPMPATRIASLDHSRTVVTAGEGEPEGFAGVAGGQAQAHVVEALLDPTANLDQPEAEGGQVHPRDAGVDEPAARRVEEPV